MNYSIFADYKLPPRISYQAVSPSMIRLVISASGPGGNETQHFGNVPA